MLADPTASSEAKRELVRTYSPPSYADPWQLVDDYERVIAYSANHPNKGSSAISSALNLPRGRIRPWLNDSQPDCYRALQTALDNTWIVDDWSQSEADALNRLAAWQLSSGSIDDRWVPTFITNDDRDEISRLHDIGRGAGVDLELTRRDDDTRPMEWRPTNDGAVLGRVLYTWTGVRGYKTSDVVQFPRYPRLAPHHIVKRFVQVYVQQRGVYRTDKGEFIQIAEHRSDRYRDALTDCIRRVTSDTDAVRATSWPIRIYEPALSELKLDSD